MRRAARAAAASTRAAAAPRRAYGSTAEMAAALVGGQRRALSKGITLVESLRPDDQRRASDLLVEALRLDAARERPRAFRVGFCGPPGVGKSSIIEALGRALVEDPEEAHRVAVLTVDPSSHFTGGSILGDKTRMPRLARHDRAFVRSSATWGTLGGLAHATGEAVTLCEAAGHDVVLVETVGVGQSEVLVAEQVDMVVLMVGPAGGDELQGLKKGIVEIADLVLVSKADGDNLGGARSAKAEYMRALHLVRRKYPDWQPPVRLVSAHEDAASVRAAWDEMREFRRVMDARGAIVAAREAQRRRALWPAVEQELLRRVRADPRTSERAAALERRLVAGELTPRAAAAQLVDVAALRQ